MSIVNYNQIHALLAGVCEWVGSESGRNSPARCDLFLPLSLLGESSTESGICRGFLLSPGHYTALSLAVTRPAAVAASDASSGQRQPYVNQFFFLNGGGVSKDPEIASLRHCRLHKGRECPVKKKNYKYTLQKCRKDPAIQGERDRVQWPTPGHRRRRWAPATAPPPGSLPLGAERRERSLINEEEVVGEDTLHPWVPDGV
jgi:hypothetical protein